MGHIHGERTKISNEEFVSRFSAQATFLGVTEKLLQRQETGQAEITLWNGSWYFGSQTSEAASWFLFLTSFFAGNANRPSPMGKIGKQILAKREKDSVIASCFLLDHSV